MNPNHDHPADFEKPAPGLSQSESRLETSLVEAGRQWRRELKEGEHSALAERIEQRMNALDREAEDARVEDREHGTVPLSEFQRTLLVVSSIAATALVAFLAATMLKPRLEMQTVGVDPAVVRAIDLAVLPSGAKPANLDRSTCDRSQAGMDPRASDLVHAGAWRVGRCYEPRSFADGTGATLYRPGRVQTAGLVLRSAPSSERSSQIGITEMRNFVIYDVAVAGMRQFLAVHRDAVVADKGGALQHCTVCHERPARDRPHPHRLIARTWNVQ